METKLEKSKTFSPTPPDEEFENAFSANSSGCRERCECGRELFDGSDNGWSWGEGELETLRKLAAEQPDNYVELGYACSRAIINGRTFVLGCPCNGLRPYQDFITTHGPQIAKYLNFLSRMMREQAATVEVK